MNLFISKIDIVFFFLGGGCHFILDTFLLYGWLRIDSVLGLLSFSLFFMLVCGKCLCLAVNKVQVKTVLKDSI